MTDHPTVPLTPLQQGLLLHARGSGDVTSYVQQSRWVVTGALDPAAVESRFAAAIAGSAALRTAFHHTTDGDVAILAEADGPAPVRFQDWRGLSRDELRERYWRLVDGERQLGFDLARPPLARLVVVRTRDDRHELVLTFHHLVLDGASVELLRDVLLAGRPAGAGRYEDFLRWYAAQDVDKHRDDWVDALAPVLTEPADPTGWSVGEDTRRRAGREQYRFRVPRALAAALEASRAELGITPANLHLGAWLATCARYSGETTVTCGVTESLRAAAGRELGADLAGELGLFTNTLPVAAQAYPDGTLTGLAEAVQQQRAGYLERRLATPLWLIGSWLRPTLGERPLFRFLFSFQEYGVRGGAAPLAAESQLLTGDGDGWFEPAAAGVHYDLALAVGPGPTPEIVIAFRPEAYDRAAVERIARYYLRLLEAVTVDPSTTLDEVGLPGEELATLLDRFNDTTTPAPGPLLPELIAGQARRTPQAVAVRCGDRSLSYRELDEAGNRLAHHLRACGAGMGSVVAVHLRRGPELVVALLGVLKSGAAYLPLDPDEPDERTQFMLADSSAITVITADAPSAGELATQPSHDPGVTVHPESPAYVIYTSGSTGRPKGVVVPHRGVVNLLAAQRRLYAAGPGDRVLQLAPIRFDASVFDLCLALGTGATLVLPEPGRASSGADLFRTLAENEITIAAVLSAALRSLPAGDLPHLRTLISGGEPIPAEVVDRWAPGRVFVSAYGPTEATVVCTSNEITAPATTFPPIGRPLPGTRMYVLDERMSPAPIGVTGELYIGGAGVARGYVGRPALTAGRFLPDPFSGEPGARLYRTGDLGRWNPDGTVTFAGRIDDQVKIRGYRVECGEIEAVLRRHPGVREAVVIAYEERPGDRRLAGYVILGPGTTARDVLRHAREQLPDYMVPSVLTDLEELPRTAHGKVDRRALPAPGTGERDLAAAFVAPLTPTEQVVANAWAEELRLDRVGRDDNFFALGGHSLGVVRIAARLSRAYGREIDPATVFGNPAVALLAAAIDKDATDGMPPLLPRPAGEDAPLSFAQERLWFTDNLAGANPFYNTVLAFRLTGSVDAVRLGAAVDVVVARHEILRSAFPVVGDRPRQRPATAAPALEMFTAPEMNAARTIVFDLARRPFDVPAGPLVRIALVSCGADDHVLSVVAHHLVTDGWSASVLLDEISVLYNGGQPPAPPVQYADFALWQRNWLGPDAAARQLDYWRERLAGAPAALQLPTDRPRPARPSFAGRRWDFAVPPSLIARVTELARREQVTAFHILLAAYGVLLARYGGQADVVVGVPVADRGHPLTERLLGLFVNTVPVRIGVAGDSGLAGLARQVRDTLTEAMRYQHAPFEQLVAVRDRSRSPLMQTLFQMLREPAAPHLDGLATAELPIDNHTTRLDLEMHVAESGEASIVYATDLFDSGTAQRLAAAYLDLLESALAQPDAPLPHGSRPEIAAVTSGEAEPLVHELVTGWAARTPDAIAVVAGDRRLTYRELDSRADALARRITRRGLGPGGVVVLDLDRGVDLAVAALAVLKAGAAYLPLHPQDPPERAARVIRDCGAALMITSPGTTEGRPCPAIAVDDPADPAGPADLPAAGPDDLAYIITTSGSTGTPKAVGVTHRSIAGITAFSRKRWEVGPGTRVALVVSFAFDVAALDFTVALTSGATLHIAPRDQVAGPALGDFLRNNAIDVMQTIPTIFTSIPVDCGASLRHLAIGGEAAPVETLRAWGARIGTVHHVYGTTEAGVYSTIHSAPARKLADGAPIGRPVPGMTVHLLDEHGRPVPDGAVGEMYIGGPGVARGYVGRPWLTAERFLPDPFTAVPGARLYRTGDLARIRPDGLLEYAGRADQQVKIRGFRIECGEIEARLREHPAVAQAAVVVQDGDGDRRLVAHLVSTGAEAPADEVRDWLSGRLPAYMIPAGIVWRTSMPTTGSGKVDRRALAQQVWEPPAPAPATAPPSPAEELVAAIWAEVLGVDEIGPGDSFFALGGHSLLIVQVAARLREVFGVDLELSTLFDHPTVAEVAELVDAATVRGHESPRRRYDLAASAEGIPLSSGQDRLWFTGRLAPGNPFYHTATTLRLRGPLDVGRLRRALTAVVARHAVLRTSFPTVNGEPSQRVAPPDEVGLRVIDADEPGEARRLAERWSRRPLDLEAGPARRFLLFRLADDDHVFLAVLHHIVADGLSIRIFLDDLGRCYAGERLPEIPVQYADFAAWQRDRDLAEGLAYWQKQLAGAPHVLRLPADRERAGVPGFAGHRLRTDLPPELMAAVARVARANTVTMFMTLLAAYAVVLAGFGAGDDVVIGSPAAGRSHRDLEPLIGLFINLMALRIDCSGDPAFADLLGRVREITHAAYDHQDVPFERVVERLAPARDVTRNPVVQTLFQVLHAGSGAELALPGVRVSTFGIDLRTTRLDLELNLIDQGDGGWFAEFVYATDLFEPATVARMADAYVRVLRQVADDPHRPLSELMPGVAGRAAVVAAPDAGPDAPRSAVERRLAVIWAEELGVERVGIYDDFFDRGGTPLTAVRAAARTSDAVGFGVDVALIFRHPTLAELTAALAGKRSL